MPGPTGAAIHLPNIHLDQRSEPRVSADRCRALAQGVGPLVEEAVAVGGGPEGRELHRLLTAVAVGDGGRRERADS